MFAEKTTCLVTKEGIIGDPAWLIGLFGKHDLTGRVGGGTR